MVSFPDSKIIKFSNLILALGQRREIDQQEPITYPSAFDTDGSPAVFETRNIGKKISAILLDVTDDFVNIDYQCREVTVPLPPDEVEKTKATNPGIKDSKAPVFKSRTRIGNIKLQPDMWWQEPFADINGRCVTWFMKVEKEKTQILQKR